MLNPFLLAMIVSTVLSTGFNTYTEDWYDKDRNRTVPVRIFMPDLKKHAVPCPVFLLSHGLGGNRNGFTYLGEHLSQVGYIVVVMQHPGSDSETRTDRKRGETPLESLAKAINPQTAQKRVEDVRFVLDELENRLNGKADLKRIGVGGHSFGSFTTFGAIGRFPFKADPRIKAAVVMSPNTPKVVEPEQAHQNIKTPILHFTGTKDRSPIDKSFDPKERRIPFDNIENADQYLVIFEDGNHMLFSGHRRPFGLTQLEIKYQPMIVEIIQKFLDAYLQEDSEAVNWLQKNELTDFMKDCGTVEIKLKN